MCLEKLQSFFCHHTTNLKANVQKILPILSIQSANYFLNKIKSVTVLHAVYCVWNLQLLIYFHKAIDISVKRINWKPKIPVFSWIGKKYCLMNTTYSHDFQSYNCFGGIHNKISNVIKLFSTANYYFNIDSHFLQKV